MRPTTALQRRRALAAGALTAALLVGTLAVAAPVMAGSGSDSAPAADLAKPGSMDALNMELLANIPKNGDFAPVSAFGSDLAFQGDYAFAGNYNGFTVYDISDPANPVQAAQVVCPGSQNDISVHKDVLVLSTDSRRTDDSCSSQSIPPDDTTSPYWEGVKVFDISDPTSPQYVASVETKCGSHTHSLAPSKDGRSVYAYVSSYSPNAALVGCQPPHDLISIVKIPLRAPQNAAVVATPVLFPDGGYTNTSGCHDITTYAKLDIAAGACMGDGILMDISNREKPVVIDTVRDTENFAFWHSATFNDDGTKVVFTDELGGGGMATCLPKIGDTRGANGIYDIEAGELVFKSYYKIPRTNTKTENCVAHNGSLIPIEGKDVMVQAWYQGGVSIFDFTDSENPTELAWFDRGPYSAKELVVGGSWSAYYYNGYVFSNDIQKGFDVLDVADTIEGEANEHTYSELNPQMQMPFNG